jgi:hypothetical protein
MSHKTIREVAELAHTRTKEIAKREGFDDDLCGLCSRASAILFDMLVENGYNPMIHQAEGWPHTFVQVRDTLIDITAKQLGESDILIISAKENPIAKGKPYQTTHKFQSIEELIKHLVKMDRIDCEIPKESDRY